MPSGNRFRCGTGNARLRFCRVGSVAGFTVPRSCLLGKPGCDATAATSPSTGGRGRCLLGTRFRCGTGNTGLRFSRVVGVAGLAVPSSCFLGKPGCKTI